MTQELLWYPATPPQTQNPQFRVTLQILRYRNQAQQWLSFTKQMLRILCVLYNIEEVVEGIWFCD
jgi:hypothetical protein